MNPYSQGYPSSSRQPAFDGPGARPILGAGGINDTSGGEPGPSSSSSLYPSHQIQQPAINMEHNSPTPTSEPRGTASPSQETTMIKRVGGKANVSSACGPCKRAHLACDIARPCKRCVNMGKEDQCEDVPHKKRGRPKVPKPALGEPYNRTRPPTQETSGVGKWRGPSVYDAPYMTGVDGPPPPMGQMPGRNSPPLPRPLVTEGDPGFSGASMPNQPFTLFTTTDFKILRASPMSYHLIGYHPNEFVNLNLLDWIHPQDRHLIDIERNRLLTVPYVEVPFRSTEVTQAAITQRSELELLSPAEGMREPYPNKNVRVLHSDNRFSPFNIRLHLGGGLGASLWQQNTLERIYLVVSFLAIPRPRDLPPDLPAAPPRRPSQIAPPTPITPVPAMPGGPGLPGFSSIAAAADAPQTRYEQPAQSYYPPPPQVSSGRPLSSQSAYPYPRAGPGPNTAPPPSGAVPINYGRRSASPSSTYRAPQISNYSMAAGEYAPPPSQSGYYPPQEPVFRRPADDEQWRGGNLNGNGMAGRVAPMSLPPGSVPGNDGARRTWEL